MSIQTQLLFPNEKVIIPGIYYFLFRPEPKLYAETAFLKKQVDSFLNKKKYSLRLPHITLFQFKWDQNSEKKLISTTDNFLENSIIPSLQSSSIEIYESSKTIYLKLENKDPAIQFQRNLISALFSPQMQNNKNLFNISSDLHLTIATGLDASRLKTLFDHLKQIEFESTEFKSTLILLKRNFSREKWEKIMEFNFNRFN